MGQQICLCLTSWSETSLWLYSHFQLLHLLSTQSLYSVSLHIYSIGCLLISSHSQQVVLSKATYSLLPVLFGIPQHYVGTASMHPLHQWELPWMWIWLPHVWLLAIIIRVIWVSSRNPQASIRLMTMQVPSNSNSRLVYYHLELPLT